MKLRFSPTAELIVIPTEVFGPKGSVVAQLALDTGQAFQSWVGSGFWPLAMTRPR
jgi:hypothetical protein